MTDNPSGSQPFILCRVMTLEAILLGAVSSLAGAVVYLYLRQEKQHEETRRELRECRRAREKFSKMVTALSRCVGRLERESPDRGHRQTLDQELREIELEYQSLQS